LEDKSVKYVITLPPT